MPQLVRVEAFEHTGVEEAYVPEWRERTVVFRLPSGRVVALDAWQHGTLVVHATWDDRDAKPFTVTHWPSRLMVCRVAEVDQAVERAEWLWRSCPRAWAGDEVDVALLPADVVQWCKENKR